MNELQSNRTLNYYICLPSKQEKENFRFSLKIEDSDIFENQNLLNNLIGTLVKYSNSGKIEPYLAYEWQALEQGKTWVFFIRENLNDSQGTPITATAIGDQLKHRLKFLKNELGILIFNKLVGWDKFVTDPKSDEIKGIVTKNNILKFHFVEPVPNLLEFLRMVYFGYWPKQEESESIQDTSINHFISSGSYVIEPNSTHQSINLKARDNWFAIQNNSFRNIHVSTCDINNLPETPQTIIRAGTSLGLNIHNKKYIKTVTAPTMLTAAIISSEVKSKVFTDVNVRKKFSYSLRKYISESITKDSTYYFANSFYTSSNKILKYENFSTHQNSIKSKMPIKIAIPGSLNLNLFKDLENSLKKSANEVGLNAIIETIDRSKPGWREKLISNNYYDIRISSVDTGANFLKEGIEMMFCTKLGVSFPDPNNKVCNLIKNVFDTDVKNQEYGQIFEDIIEKQAAVIPLFHSGVLWLQSTDLLPLTPSIGTNHPRFDNLQLNYDSK